jgi:hypothetical protein
LGGQRLRDGLAQPLRLRDAETFGTAGLRPAPFEVETLCTGSRFPP